MDVIAILKSELGARLGQQVSTLTGLDQSASAGITDTLLPAIVSGFIAEHRNAGTAYAAVESIPDSLLSIKAESISAPDKLNALIDRTRPLSRALLGSKLSGIRTMLASIQDIPLDQVEEIISLTGPQVAAHLKRVSDLTGLNPDSFNDLLDKQSPYIRKALAPELLQTISDSEPASDSARDNASAELFEDSDKTVFIPDLGERIKQSMVDSELKDIEFEPTQSALAIADVGSIDQKVPADTQELSGSKPTTQVAAKSPVSAVEESVATLIKEPPVSNSATEKKEPYSEKPETNSLSSTIDMTEEPKMSNKNNEIYNETPRAMKWLIIPLIIFLLVAAWLLSRCSGPKDLEVSAPSLDVDASGMAKKAMDATTSAVSAVGETVGNAVEGGMDMAGTAGGVVGDTVGSAVDAGASMAEAATAAAGDAVGGATDAAKELAGSVVGATAGAVDAATNAVSETGEAASNAVADAVASAKEVALPDGTALKLSDGSPVDRIVHFLKSDNSETALPKAFILRGLNFESGSSRITADSSKIVSDLAATLSAYPSVKVLLAGHTDSQGAAEFNKSLSASRAAAVKTALASAGINSDRIDTDGFGEENPIDDNTTAAGRLENRRVEVIITKK